jgi:hypothetical protein
MQLKDLLAFATNIALDHTTEEIKARLIWRNEEGCVYREEIADLGYSSGLRPLITVEMSTQSNSSGIDLTNLPAVPEGYCPPFRSGVLARNFLFLENGEWRPVRTRYCREGDWVVTKRIEK